MKTLLTKDSRPNFSASHEGRLKELTQIYGMAIALLGFFAQIEDTDPLCWQELREALLHVSIELFSLEKVLF